MILKAMEHESDRDTNGDWCTWNGLLRNGKEVGETGNQRRNGDHRGHSTIKISSNTRKSPGDFSENTPV